MGIGNMLAMTWWIGPHAYGFSSTAMAMVAFLSNVARAGIDTYLVRMENYAVNPALRHLRRP